MSTDVETIDHLIQRTRLKAQTSTTSEFWHRFFESSQRHTVRNVLYLADFLRHDGEAFIVSCYEHFLDRDPHKKEIENGLHLPLHGEPEKIAFIRSLLNGEEFRKRNRVFDFVGLNELESGNRLLLRLKSLKLFSIFSQLVVRGWYKKNLANYLELTCARNINRSEALFFLSYGTPIASKRWMRILRRGISAFTRFVLRALEFSVFFLFESKESFLHRQVLRQSRPVFKPSEVNSHEPEMKYARTSVIPASVANGPKYYRDHNSGYFAFENKFRGSEHMVTKRLEFYLPIVRDLYMKRDIGPALDVGFGRCEWLELLTHEKIPCLGLDIDPDLVHRAREKGFQAEVGSASDWLANHPANKLGLVSAFHVVEHLEFSHLLDFFTTAYRALAPQGILILETPNPENLIVGSYEFWLDPTHVQPYPAPTLEFWLKSIGFEEVRVELLHPSNLLPIEGVDHEGIRNLIYRVNMERDYAIVARKRA